MPETNPDKKNKLQNLSPSAQILSNVEMLVAMCEDQERAAIAANEPADTSVIESAVEKSVKAAVNDTVAQAVQTAFAETLSGSIEKALDACFTRFDKRIAQLEDHINQVGDQQNKLDGNVQAFNARFDSLDEKIDSAPPRSDLGIAAIESQLGPQLDTIGTDLADVVSNFENKFASLERTFQDQCKTVNGFYAKLNATVGTKNEANTNPETDAPTEPLPDQKEAVPDAEDSTSDWQLQKQAMLAKYDSDHQPLEQAADAEPGELASDGPTTPATDLGEVEKLKSDLNSKLREAEVELSINRARLSQERAEFERNQAELDRRTAELEAKMAAMTSDGDGGDDTGSTDLMTRFKRHLGT